MNFNLKFSNIMNWFFRDIAKDKLMHFFYGAIIAFPLVFLFGILGLMLSLIGFALKELLLDLFFDKGKAEIMDFVFSAVPAVLFYLMRFAL